VEFLGFFEWMESSMLGTIGKTYGGVYALGQSLHLMSLAVLGGTVLVTDLRLLNVILQDVPSELVEQNAHKWFRYALLMIVITGIFMAAAVATRMYYNQFFWAKMFSLSVGVLFVFAVKHPLLASGAHSDLGPWTIRILAVASIIIWFTVAATGRWIGFS
jgi:hypothetical protein